MSLFSLAVETVWVWYLRCVCWETSLILRGRVLQLQEKEENWGRSHQSFTEVKLPVWKQRWFWHKDHQNWALTNCPFPREHPWDRNWHLFAEHPPSFMCPGSDFRPSAPRTHPQGLSRWMPGAMTRDNHEGERRSGLGSGLVFRVTEEAGRK